MATANRVTDTEDLTVERYVLELNDGEDRDLLADPEAFVRNLLGEGHTINRLSIDTQILRAHGCTRYEVVHVVEGTYRSSHILQCMNPE